MIIIPSEKRFDWQRAPIALTLITFLNILVFILYQSGDTEKFQQALEQYEQQQHVHIEWPVFKDYLQKRNETELLAEYETQYKQNFVENISNDILSRTDFYQHLKQNIYAYITVEEQGKWEPSRDKIQATIYSISYYSLGLTPSDLSIATLITSQFLHGDIIHLLGNMFFLVIFGFAVEAALGGKLFLLFYLVSGVAGGLLHALIERESSTPLVGASGAISGVMAMYLAIFRLKKIEFFYWFFIFVGYFRAPALSILPFYLLKEIISYFTDTTSNVAFMAHTGGFIMGAISIAVLLKIKPQQLDEQYIEEEQSIDPIQQDLAKAYNYIEKFQFQLALKQVSAIQQTYGNSFELSLMQYHLAKISKGQGYEDIVLHLLNTKHPTIDETISIEHIWKENPGIEQKLSDKDALSLGMRFATLNNLSSSENLFSILQDTCTDKVSLSIYAQKLAYRFEGLKDYEKKNHYSQLSEHFQESMA